MPECAICKSDMDVDPFDAAASEGLCGTECFRLSCKHAFHATCVVQSLRAAGSGCPVCRDGAVQANSGRIIFEMQFDDEEDDEEEQFVDRVVHALNSTSPSVAAAKRVLNQSVKEYNIFRDKLRRERKRVLVAAMRDFRSRRYHDFQAIRRRTAQALDNYHTQLRNELGVTPDDLHFSTPDELLRQPLHMGSSVRHQDPMRLSFWH